MYTTCPKCQHTRTENDLSNPDVCPACGVVFSKWIKHHLGSNKKRQPESQENKVARLSRLLLLFTYTEEKVNPFIFYGRMIVLIAMIILGWKFIDYDFTKTPDVIGNSFLHTINLVFHEAGHVIFMPFGWFMTKLGGTLGQLLMPVIVFAAFLFKYHNPFAASVAVWWLGQSFIDCSPYIDDAYDQKLTLLGGFTGKDKPGSHDWNNILSEYDMVDSHRMIATTFDSIGIILIVLAILWGTYILTKQYKHLDKF